MGFSNSSLIFFWGGVLPAQGDDLLLTSSQGLLPISCEPVLGK